MKRRLPIEFLYQVFSLIVAVIIVHAIYVSMVRPQADAILLEREILMEQDPNFVPERSLYVIIRDFEQETCFILMLWAFALMGYKALETSKERNFVFENLVDVGDGMNILPEDTREYARSLQAMDPEQQRRLLPRALLTALHRFRSTRSIQDVSTAVKIICDTEYERMDTELSMVRYLAWAIPSVGFIGTVRGIGQALGRANEAVAGDISGVTQSLGIAFNSTFVALVISIVVMFLLHQLQEAQERLVLDSQNYVDENLIRYLQVR
ncbi:MAG: MotA/TolQ/ExbB proton channel family protein [Gammaproteobacteria bacterium]|nr:MotA/TolQ/ExbB proton channel family protein [Gammaproteobacteria bacterium]